MPPQGVDPRVVRDAEEPAREPAIRVEGREVAKRLDEAVLRQVLGQGRVAGQADEQRQDGPLMPADELLERRLRAAEGLGDEAGLGNGLEIELDGSLPPASLRSPGTGRCDLMR